jgi:hypothetical protein
VPIVTPVDLTARREAVEAAIAAVAAAPVRFVPAELLIALQGSWGDPEPAPARLQLRLAR